MGLLSAGVLMTTETPTLAIVLGFVATIITSIVGAFVATRLRKSEKEQSAELVLEKALRERIVLRDEALAEAKEDLAHAIVEKEAAEARAEKAEKQRDRLYLAIVEQRAEEKVRHDDA